ncbi:MAG: hypothetical protein K2H43_03530 [Clostridia bacterium]|nr:hypothetical protein [Clostridia bacterium]
MADMENYIRELDDSFCEQYSDYVRLSALEGYEMPDTLYVAPDGNIARRDSSVMRLCYQKKKDELLKKLKAGIADTTFTFSFSFRSLRDKFADLRRKYTFSKILPDALKHCGETAESAGEKLDIEPRFWKKMVSGKLYPEKNTVLALALVCRMQAQDCSNLLAVCGFSFDDASIRDVLTHYLIEHRIFNEEMRDNCLAEYKITNLPIKRRG